MLKALASALSGQVRTIDIVARLGGEEFVLLLPLTDAAGALVAAERVRTAVEHLSVRAADGTMVRFTVSMGIVEASQGAPSLEEMLHLADTALYEAKRQGRNRSIVATVPTPGMSSHFGAASPS